MKFKPFLFYIFVVLAGAVVLSWIIFLLSGRSQNTEGVLAKVGDVEITVDQVNKFLPIGADDDNYDPVERKKRQREILDQLITIQVMKKEAAKRGVSVSEDELNSELDRRDKLYGEKAIRDTLEEHHLTFDEYRENLRNELLYTKVSQAIQDELKKSITITDEEIQNYYDNNKENYNDSEISLIYINIPHPGGTEEIEKARSKAEEVISKLINGEDFAELARQYSEDVASKDSGGYLGSINTAPISNAIRKIALGLAPGEFNKEPVKVQNGFPIIKRLNEAYIPLEDVKEKIKEMLREVKLRTSFTDYVHKLKEQADIQEFEQ